MNMTFTTCLNTLGELGVG